MIKNGKRLRGMRLAVPRTRARGTTSPINGWAGSRLNAAWVSFQAFHRVRLRLPHIGQRNAGLLHRRTDSSEPLCSPTEYIVLNASPKNIPIRSHDLATVYRTRTALELKCPGLVDIRLRNL